ncbi:MAG: hypothetical protein FJX74_19860 [Armatimonadetes bacterium]|nr:hypothetical protein [Armatimonadota bacterium]
MPTVSEVDVPALIVGLALMVLALLVVTALGPLSQGALALAISEQYLGRTVGVLEAYRRVMGYWWQLLLVGLAFGLLMALGPLVGILLGAGIGVPIGLYVVPDAGPIPALVGGSLGLLAGLPVSMLFFTWFVFYEQALVLDRIPGLDSLQRSRSLGSGHGWRVFGVLMLAGIAISVATMVLSAPVSITAAVVASFRAEFLPYANLLSQCAQQVVNVLLGPVFMIVQTLTYYDLRIRKEGFDLQMMAATVEALRGPRAPGESETRPEDVGGTGR